MENHTISRRVALLAAQGTFLLFIEHIIWDGEIAGRTLWPDAKPLVAGYLLWIFIGAVLSYLSLLKKGKLGLAFELASAVFFALPFLAHIVALSDIWG